MACTRDIWILFDYLNTWLQCKRNNMILHSACRNRQLDVVKELINLDYDPNTKDRTVLSVASIVEDLDAIGFLLSVGADTNILDIWHKTPLIRVCETCDDIEVVKELLQPSSLTDGTNPNIRTKISSNTALTKSITRSKIEYVKLLLLSSVEGIDFTRIDELCRTRLEYTKSLDPFEHGEIIAVLENYIPSFHSLTLRCINKNKIGLNNLPSTLISAWSDV